MGVVYEISNIIDDRVYIGSSVDVKSRWSEHKRDLSNNKHRNIHLQRFVDKYGLDVLKFKIIEEVPDDILLGREQYYLDVTSGKFNISTSATAPMMGKIHSKEALTKIAKRSAGSNNPMYGSKRPQWLIDKLTEASKGRSKTLKEKIVRQIKLRNRKEIKLIKGNKTLYCFSISHAAVIIGVSQQSVSQALNKASKSKGWVVLLSADNFYKKDVLLSNIHLFDQKCHPKKVLIQILKQL